MLRPEEQAALGSARGAVVALGDDGRIGFASRAAQRLLGWDDGLVGQPLSAIIPEDLRARQRAGYEGFVLARGRPQASVHRHDALCRDGSRRPVQVQVAGFRRPDGSLFVCAGIADAAAPLPDVDPVEDALARWGYRRV